MASRNRRMAEVIGWNGYGSTVSGFTNVSIIALPSAHITSPPFEPGQADVPQLVGILVRSGSLRSATMHANTNGHYRWSVRRACSLNLRAALT